MKKLIIFITFFCCLPQVISQAKYYIDNPLQILKTNPVEEYDSFYDVNEKSFLKSAGVTKSYSYWFKLGENNDVPLSLLDTGKPELYIENHFDTNGNVTKEIIKAIDEDKVIVYFYNSKCRLSKYISNKDSSDEYECNLIYDTAGNVTQIEALSKFRYMRHKTFFVYDALNNLIEKKKYIDDTLDQTTEYKYDKFGNNIEKKTIYFNKSNTDFERYTIEYDDEGKILYRTGYHESNKMFDEERYEYKSGKISEIFYDWGIGGLIAKFNISGFLISLKHYQKREEGVEIIYNKNYYNACNLITKILIRDSYVHKKNYGVNIFCYEYR